VGGAQHVVGDPKAGAGKQVTPIAVVGEGPRFAYQLVDDVAILDPMPSFAAQPGNVLDLALGVVDLEMVCVETDPHPFAGQTAVDGVGIVTDPDGAETAHPHLQTRVVLRALGGQLAQHFQLFGEALLPPGVELTADLAEEGFILVARGEVTAATQHQALPDGTDKAVVALFDIAVFVGAARVGLAPLDAVVAQQGAVALGELLRVAEFVHRGAQAVRLVSLGDTPQLPQGVLQPPAEGLKALGETDRGRLPVGVG